MRRSPRDIIIVKVQPRSAGNAPLCISQEGVGNGGKSKIFFKINARTESACFITYFYNCIVHRYKNAAGNTKPLYPPGQDMYRMFKDMFIGICYRLLGICHAKNKCKQ